MSIANVCRTCLRIPQNSTNLFESHINLVHKIETISSVRINDDPNLPRIICQSCFHYVNTFYSFRKLIINTDNDLRLRYETPKKRTASSERSRKSPDKDESMEVNIKTELILIETDEDHALDVPEPVYIVPKEKIQPLNKTLKLFVKCSQCDERFVNEYKLKWHMKHRHPPRGVCNICGAVMRSDNLRQHINMHNEGPIKCNICNKTLKNSGSLRTHKLCHNDNPFTCEICGNRFMVRSEYTRHLKTHADPDYRKVTCPLCGKKIRRLRRHMQTHTGEKPYKCKECDKCFSSGYALKIHKRQHTNERPYVCELCGEAFPQKVSLSTHLSSKHQVTK